MGVRVTRASVLQDVCCALPFGSRLTAATEVDHLLSFVVRDGSSAVEGDHVLLSGSRQILRTPDYGVALHTLENELATLVGELARGRVFVHAGAVGFEGGTIVIPGPSNSGKSTLVAALLRAGATYYSDEFAVLDEEGLTHPFARPLSIRSVPGSVGESTPAEALGAPTGNIALPVCTVLFTRFREGARFRPRRLTPGRAVLGLMANSLCARSRPAETLSILDRAVSAACAFRSVRGEAGEVASRLLGDPRYRG